MLELKINIVPIAFESLGVRSMCTYIETPDIRILIDPGVALGLRYGKHPHPREYKSLMEARRKIYEASEKAEVIIITHYHTDHYTPLKILDYLWIWSEPERVEKIYEGKRVFIKDYRNNINFNQMRRGWIFWKLLNKIDCETGIADGKIMKFNGTEILISNPVPHGEIRSKLGYVLMVKITFEEENILYTSDIQGPQSEEITHQIISLKPKFIIIGGPATYVTTSIMNIEETINNITKLKEITTRIILDHHILRDKNWKKYFNKIKEKVEKKDKIQTAAEYLGKRNKTLECIRDKLYEREEPSKEFMKWCKAINKHHGKEPPPI
ncbi:MAG: MBL fold metallo-hydrolase [Candidatus Methanomethylicia archaeon]